MAYVIAEPCWTTKDKACVPACPVDCSYEGPKMLYIHPEECSTAASATMLVRWKQSIH